MNSVLKVKRLRENANIPVRASRGASAYDICAAIEQPLVIPPGGFHAVPTGIAIELMPDHVALIFSRSSFGHKYRVSLANSVGVIDSDYRGEILVGLVNNGSLPFSIEPGDRIAQMLITYALAPDIVETHALSKTERGTGGFGSTGIKTIHEGAEQK